MGKVKEFHRPASTNQYEVRQVRLQSRIKRVKLETNKRVMPVGHPA